MKRTLSAILSLLLLLSLTSCIFGEVVELEGDGREGYFYEYSDGIKSITNYHPYKIWALPDYQELIQFGDDVGLENEGEIYFVCIVDTSMDSDSPSAYYFAELDGETKELLCEEGEYFADDESKKSTVEKLVEMIDSVYLK